MKLLITGGAGYIGTAILRELNYDNYSEVIVYDNFCKGSSGIIEFLKNRKIRFVKGDVRDKKIVEYVNATDAIIHLAAIVGTPECNKNPHDAKSVNIDGTALIAGAVSKTEKKFIFASTGAAYGKVEGVCTEETLLNPNTLYASSKAEGEIETLRCLNGVVLRLATLYGLSNVCRTDLLINNLMCDAVKNRCITLFQGHVTRTFLDVTDAARCFILALENWSFSAGVYNVGDSCSNYKKIEVAEKISKLTGAHLFQADYNSDPDFRDYSVSYAKVAEKGFYSQRDFHESLLELKQYYEL